MVAKPKVMTIVGTRPEIIRLSRIISLLDEYCDHVLVHTGQNFDYELNEVFFNELGIRRPDEFLDAAGSTAAESIGRIIIAADTVLGKHCPEALLILGDTNSCLSAISAKRRKIPIFHMEAGNRCYDFRVPEEINRRIVDHTSDINLTYSQIAREYLLREGFPAERIVVTGSPMKEVIDYYSRAIEASNVLERLGLAQHQYFVVSVHREENVDDPARLKKVIALLDGLVECYAKPIIFSTHPRTRKKLEALGYTPPARVLLHKPFGFLDYVHLQVNAHCVLSDSGTITEESSILNFPALNLRETHERPEGTEETSVMMVGLELQRTLQAMQILDRQSRGSVRQLAAVRDYSVDNVSAKVLRIIVGYIDFVNRTVWHKC